MKRLVTAAAAAVALSAATVGTASAGDQAIVDKGIDFLDQIQGQVQLSSCSAFASDMAGKGVTTPTTLANFNQALAQQAAKRRDFVTKRAGGLTAAQAQQYETALANTAVALRSKAQSCGFIKAPAPAPKPQPAPAPAPAPKPQPAPQPAPQPKPKPEPAPQPAPAPAPGLTKVDGDDFVVGGIKALQIINPMDPAHPILLPIPPFVPQMWLAQYGHLLPAGSSLMR